MKVPRLRMPAFRVPALFTGLGVTLRHMLRRSTTRQYPEVAPELPPRSRGVIALHADNCTSCMLCARECPDWCIYIDSHKEKGPDGKNHNELDRFAIDFSLCMYCGICIEVCPFDALFWAPDFDYATYDVGELIHERDLLGGWLQTAPGAPGRRDPDSLHDRGGTGDAGGAGGTA